MHKHLQTKIEDVKKSLDKKLDDLEDKYVYSPEDLSTIRSNIAELFDEQAHLERVSDRTSTQLDSYVQLTSDKLEELMKDFSDMEKATTSQTDVRHIQNEVRVFFVWDKFVEWKLVKIEAQGILNKLHIILLQKGKS